MNYYPHHIGDYASHTTHLSLLEHGVYRRMLDIYYLNEVAFAPDVAVVYRKVGARSEDEKRAVDEILAEFFTLAEDGYRQRRCDAEIQAFKSKSEQASRAGKASAERRSNDRSTEVQRESNDRSTDVQRESNDRSTDVQPTSNQEPVTKNHKPTKSKAETATASRLPADWLPDAELIDFCKAERPDLHPEAVAHRFRDYWIAKAGKDSRKADWSATWRNWVRNEKPSMQARASPSRPEKFDPTAHVNRNRTKASNERTIEFSELGEPV